MGDIEHRPGKVPQKALQPLQGLQVQVAGGLVQQQHRRALEEEPPQLELDALPAGEGAYGPVAVELLRREAELPDDVPQLPGGEVVEGRAGGAELVHAPRLLLLRQVLGKVAHGARLTGTLPRPLAVGLHQGRVIDPLEEGGLAVALLPDEDGLVSVIEDKGKSLHQRPQVPPVGQSQILDLKHKTSSLSAVRRQQKNCFRTCRKQLRTQGAPKSGRVPPYLPKGRAR